MRSRGARSAAASAAARDGGARPVLLATVDADFEPEAVRVATEAAAAAGSDLLVCDVTNIIGLGCTVGLGCRGLWTPARRDAQRAIASAAARDGVHATLLHVRTLRPLTALLEVAARERAGLLVFGPARRETSAAAYRRAARRLRRDADCLLWLER
jgi:hypothetical protein